MAPVVKVQERKLPKSTEVDEELAAAVGGFVEATDTRDEIVRSSKTFGTTAEYPPPKMDYYDPNRAKWAYDGKVDRVSAALPKLKWAIVENEHGWNVWAVPLLEKGEHAIKMQRFLEHMRVRISLVHSDNWFVVPVLDDPSDVPPGIRTGLAGHDNLEEASGAATAASATTPSKTTSSKAAGGGDVGAAPAYSARDANALVPGPKLHQAEGSNWLEVVKDNKGSIDKCIMHWRVVRAGLPGIDTSAKVKVAILIVHELDAAFALSADLPQYYTNDGVSRRGHEGVEGVKQALAAVESRTAYSF